MYIAARDYLWQAGVERLSLCHWRRSSRERSLYNTLAKAGASVYAFGCGGGGHFGDISWMNHRDLAAYNESVAKGDKPLMMAARQVAPQMRQIADAIIGNLEKGYVDFRHLLTTDSRLSELETVLALWQERGLLEKDLGVYRLTPAGEFWYVSLTQSLLECVQVVMTSSAAAPAEDINGHDSDALDEVLAEMLPQSTQESRRALMGKIPTDVRMMLRRSSKESLQSMLAGMPPAMREKMFSRASG